MRRRRLPSALAAGLCLAFAACQSANELGGLAGTPPLDYAVLVTGGAFLSGAPAGQGTFADGPVAVGAESEPIPVSAVLDVLGEGRVFHRAAVDPDPSHRRALRAALQAGAGAPELPGFLQEVRDAGYDLMLVVEELHDGPIEAQGINSRWPVTFLTWILLGFGAVIPDHTFESRATLRVTLRDLQTGRVLHDPVLVGGPIELSLDERSDFWGLILSILVPPFWVGDDPASVRESVRTVVQRRLLVSLARDLKSESARQHLRERCAANLTLVDVAGEPQLLVATTGSLTTVRLRAPVPIAADVSAAFERALLGSLRRDGERFLYQAPVPAALRGTELQVLVGTIRGDVASATFAPGGRP